MFMAALFTIAKTWKQLNTLDRWRDKDDVGCVYTHTHTPHKCTLEYCSGIKRMKQCRIILNEVSWKEKDKYHVISLICGIQNMTQMNLPRKQTHRCRTQSCGYQGEGGWGKGGVGAWISRCKLLHKNKVLLYTTRNCIQYPVTIMENYICNWIILL